MPATFPSDDFRARAVDASVRLMVEAGRADPLEAGVSLCLPTGNPPSSLKRQKWLAIGCLVAGFAGLAAGAGIAIWQERLPDAAQNDWWLVGAGACSVGGIVCLLLPALCGGRIMRKHLGQRLDDLRSSPHLSEVVYVEVEDASTFTKLKASTEDAAYVGLDPVHRRIVVEGVLCRYVVRAEDVERLGPIASGGSVGADVVYRIDDHVSLRIALARTFIWSEVIHQITGKLRNPLFKKIEETLRPVA